MNTPDEGLTLYSNKSRISIYRDLFNPAADGVFFVDDSGRIVEVNRRGCELFQYAHEEILGLYIQALISPQNLKQDPLEIHEVPDDHTLVKERRLVRKDGSDFIAEVQGRRLADNLVLGILRDITSHRETSETLHLIKERYRQMVEMANEGIWSMDKNHTTNYANSKMAEMLGYSVEEMIGKPVEYFMFSEDMEDHAQKMKLRHAGEPDSYERRFRKKNGSVLWTSVSATADVDDMGNFLGSFAMFTDITAHKLAEMVREARLHLMQFALTNILDEVLQETLDTICALTGSAIGFYHFLEEDQQRISLQAWSSDTLNQYCKMNGKGLHYSIDQAGVWVDCIRERRAVIHNDYLSLQHRKGFPPGHAEVIRELVVPVIRGERIVAILGVGNKVINYDQQDVEMVSSFADLAWDIAERKRMDEKIRASEERFRSFVENINDTAYMISPEGILTYVSPNVKEILGFDANELVGKSFKDIVHPEDYSICLQSIQNSFANAEKQSGVEFRIQDKKGDWIWQISNSSPIIGVDGKPVSALGISRDITERKLTEEKLRNRELQSQKQLLAITRPEGDIGDLELADIFDYETMQSLMDDFYELTHVGIGIIDMKGRVLVAKGWQTICSHYFRQHPVTLKNCIESDIELTKDVTPGSFIGYKCKNHLWDFSTPIVLGGKHFGNIFLGQFFFEDETPDRKLFHEQAQLYGFDEEAFLEALDQVPRWSHEKVETILRFYSKLATVISTLNFSNLLLARTLTEKDQLLTQLAKSEERYRTVADFTSDWETWVDPSGYYLYCSPSCYGITGYKAEEFIHDPTLIFRIIHPDDLFILEDHYKNQYLEHESQYITFRLITKNNNIRWIEHVCISVYGDSGDYLGKRASYRDVTQKHLAQENLEKQEKILEASQRTAHVGSYQLDFEKNTVEWTKETFNIFGLGETDHPPSVEEYKLLIHPEDIQEVYEHLNESITTGQTFDLVYRIIRPNGTMRFVHSLGTPEMNSDGVVVRLAGTLQDVTESKLIENELKSSLNEKTVLIREVHHRVKNNLAAILGLIEIERHALNDPDVSKVMMELGNRIKSMAVVHEQLYRSDNLSLIGFESYLNSFIPYLRLSFQSVENIDIQVIAQDIELSLDLAVPCGLIVNELLTNALKHAFPTASERSSNSEPLTISITMQNQNGHYILSVSDNGIGMPDDFNWRETQTLGLRMVRMLCEHQLGGKMELDQTNGTQFLIHFSGRRQRIENGQK